MKRIFLLALASFTFFVSTAQSDAETANPKLAKSNADKAKQKADDDLKNDTVYTPIKLLAATSIKNQAQTNTCWCFASTSLLESQCIKNNASEVDISEMFTVRNTYLEKAKNYLLRQGKAQFSEGGLGHDAINTIAKYGAMPEAVYSGLLSGQTDHNHTTLIPTLKNYVDDILKAGTIKDDWQKGFVKILDSLLGTPPQKFTVNGKEYTPKTFAENVLRFNAEDYVYITSFTHHPYYKPFIVEVPDNFSNGAYYNLPLDEMLQVTKDAVNSGYTVMWDADVSNTGFQQKIGAAVNFANLPSGAGKKGDILTGQAKDAKWDATIRQQLFENLTTQDDHLMHIIGLQKSKNGNTFFRVKNSWGNVGPYHGYINVSEGYFAINTITLIIPKAGVNKKLLEKLGIK
jgi:bleomycin hydrolase